MYLPVTSRTLALAVKLARKADANVSALGEAAFNDHLPLWSFLSADNGL
jgi:hypothetical protein